MAEQTTRKRRADAERNVTAILDAAIEVLADRPDASVAAVARAAGVTRQTVYAHYPSAEALRAAVLERALAESIAAIDGAELDRGTPGAALARLIPRWWSNVGRHARVLGSLAGPGGSAADLHEFHAPILERLIALIERGRRDGTFDAEVPAAWLASTFLALVHAAADEVAGGRMSAADAEQALERTVPAALAAPTE
jgi:AcrR family transcriptional regulator